MTAVAVEPVLGVQTPRLHLVPAGSSSGAEDAIALYEACGQKCYPWQELCLDTGLRETVTGEWAAFEVGIICARQNGKGVPVEALCLAALFIWGYKKIDYSAHRGKTVQDFKKRVTALIKNTPDLLRRCKPINPSDDQIELITGAVLSFRTRTRAGGRGETGDLVILDEALEVDDDELASLVPTMLTQPHAMLWYVSTPPSDGDQYLCSVRGRALAGDAKLAWAEWGVAAGEDLSDPWVLARANPSLGMRITVERILSLRPILGDRFAAECGGVWPALAAGAALDPARWKTMVDVESRRAPGGDVVMSLDCTPMRDRASIGMHGYRADGLEHVQLVDYEDGVDWMVERAAVHNEVLAPALWVLDRKSGAFALVPELAKVGIRVPGDPRCPECRLSRCTEGKHNAMPPVRGNLVVLGMQEVADSVAQFIDLFKADPSRLRHINQDPLNLAVSNVKIRPIGDAGQIAWGRKLSNVDIGPIVSVTQARYGSQLWLTRRAAAVRSKVW